MGGDDLARVEEADPACSPPLRSGGQSRLLDAPLEAEHLAEGRGANALAKGAGRHQEHEGRLSARPDVARAEARQASHARGDVAGRRRKALLHLVDAEGDDDRVDGRLRFQAGDEVAQAVLVVPLEGIVPDRRPAVQALLDDAMRGPELGREHPGPPYPRREPGVGGDLTVRQESMSKPQVFESP